MMKPIFFTLMLCVCQLVLSAQEQLFNDNWQFHKGDILNGEQNNNDTATWRNVLLPHDWSIEGPFSEPMIYIGTTKTPGATCALSQYGTGKKTTPVTFNVPGL